jgi:hypothetical protein
VLRFIPQGVVRVLCAGKAEFAVWSVAIVIQCCASQFFAARVKFPEKVELAGTKIVCPHETVLNAVVNDGAVEAVIVVPCEGEPLRSV